MVAAHIEGLRDAYLTHFLHVNVPLMSLRFNELLNGWFFSPLMFFG
jgi:hypothetical protein